MIRLSKSVLSEKEKHAVWEVLDRGYLGMGSEVALFEKELAAYLGVHKQSVICVNTGTAALHLSVMSLGLKEGDEVLVPSITYVASYQAISATGAKPVSCDIDPSSILIDLKYAATKVTPRTKAIMPVHYASNVSSRENVYKFAEQHNLRVIEDAAHSFGCTDDHGLIGAHGDIICFSFDGIKNITSGEGGAVITHDPEVQAFIRDARLLGVQNDSEKRAKGERSWTFDVSHQGFRYHMSDVMAAIGRAQLSDIGQFIETKSKLLTAYQDRLKDVSSLVLLDLPRQGIVPHIFVIRVLNGLRDALRTFLDSKDVQTGIHYQPNHLLSFYKIKGEECPCAELVSSELLSLPMHAELTVCDVESITNFIEEFISAAGYV